MKTYSYYGFNNFVILVGYKQHIIMERFSNYFLHTSDITFDFTGGKKEMTVQQKHAEPRKATVIDIGLNTMTGGCIDSAKKCGYRMADQVLVGCVFHGKIKVIPSYKYNHLLFHEGEDYRYKKIFSMSKEERKKCCWVYWDEDFSEAENETIIHFAGLVSKPWHCLMKVKDGEYDVEIPLLRQGLTK